MDFFVPKSVPRTVPGSSSYQNPYHVPYQQISYQKKVPRTKIRTGTDFRNGTVVHAYVCKAGTIIRISLIKQIMLRLIFWSRNVFEGDFGPLYFTFDNYES